MQKILCLLLITGCLTSCMAPLILGGGAVATGMAVREKSVGSSISDTQISMNVKGKFYAFNTDMHAAINVNVQNFEVLLTGIIKDQNWKDTAEKLAWEVQGVKEVYNYIDVKEEEEGVGDLTGDGWITTKAKSKLMGMDDVYSLNYNIKTVNQVIYIMGIAQDQKELERVTTALGNLSGVKKIVSLVQIKDEIANTKDKSKDGEKKTTETNNNVDKLQGSK